MILFTDFIFFIPPSITSLFYASTLVSVNNSFIKKWGKVFLLCCRCSADPALLWLWRRPAAAADQPLGREFPYAARAALKSKEKSWKWHYNSFLYG